MRFFVGLLALFLIPGSAVACRDSLVLLLQMQDLWMPLAAGILTGILLYFLVIRKLTVISTFEHELTHALVALLIFRRIHKFVVTRNRGGQVQYSGKFGGEFGDLVIGLAPYFLPTFTLISALVRPFLPKEWFPWYDGFIGFTLAFQFLTNIEETRQSWTKKSFSGAGDRQKTKSDIGKVGYIFAFLVIPGFGLFLYGIIFCLMVSGYQGLWAFFKSVVLVSGSLYADLFYRLYIFLQAQFHHWM